MTQHWWFDFFDEDFVDAFALQDRHIEVGVRVLLRELEIGKDDIVFDQCCGFGRIALPLASHGVQVVGVDACSPYIDAATARAKTLSVGASFSVGDAFRWAKPNHFTAAYNWGTSFGYLPDDSQNLAMLERAFESLVPGGRYALEYYSVPKLLKGFQSETLYHVQTSRGPLSITRQASIDWSAGLLEQRWTYERPSIEPKHRGGITRMYMPHEFVMMFKRAGFSAVKLCSLDGGPFSASDDRLVIVGRKP